ncbi:alginate export family protein [soil metagenome]
MNIATRFIFLFTSLVVPLLWPTVCAGQYYGGSSNSKSFSLQRWEEDYSYLKDRSARSDIFDPIKFIPLNSAGDFYISFGGQARYRYDYFNNRSFGPGQNDEDGWHLQRYLVHADAHFGEHLRAFVQLSSSFNDGREGGSRYGDEQHLDFQQAFVDIKTSEDANPFAYVRLGRQELTYGAERFVGPDDWRNVRRSFDGAKLAVSIRRDTFEVFLVRPVIIEQTQWDNDEPGTVFAGFYNVTALPDVINVDANSRLDVYFFALNQDADSTARVDTDTYTVGARFHSKPKPFDFDIEGNYQFGEVASESISAWSFAAEAGYTFAGLTLSPRASVGFDIASGSSDPEGRFNQLYPPTYTYLGHLYLFGRTNLIDAHVGLDFHLTDSLTLFTAHHTFWRQNDNDALYYLNSAVVRADTGSDAAYVGNEFDIALTWQINRHISAYMGYAHFFTGDFIAETGASKDADFLYASVTFTF